MAEHLGKMIECDRCGKTHFLHYTGIRAFDGGYTSVSVSDFQKRPEGWGYHLETGLLCDECEKTYQDILDEFFDR